MRDIILYFACKYFGDWERIYDAIEKQEDIDFDKLEEYKELHEENYYTVVDDEYPAMLKLVDRPPFVIFMKGNKKLLESKKKVWYYGNYYNDDYDEYAVQHKEQFDDEEITLISGYTTDFERKLLNNIDSRKMIIVRDSGIESNINMTKIEERQFLMSNLIISEYPDKLIPSMHSWEMSGRIKSGLSNGMVLLNSIRERTTFRLISEAIDANKKIYCFKEELDKKSHNTMLISKGAYGISNIEDIKELKKND